MSIYLSRRGSAVLSLALALLVALAGCGDSLNTCEGLESWVKDLSAESEGWQPIHKIHEIEEESRTETRVDCTGRAKLQDGSSIYISFYNLIDSDGDYRYGFGVLRPSGIASSANPSATPRPTSTPRPPTPTLDPTKEMTETVAAAAYIINWEYYTDFRYLCDDYDLEKRIDDWGDDLTRFELRAADKSFIETPRWHQELREIADELETLVRLIDRRCLEK